MAILFSSMAALLIVSVPIFAVMGVSAAIAIYLRGIPLLSIPQNVFEALDSFTLLAIPFYVLAGNIMKSGGISRRLIHIARALTSWLRGGMGCASVLTCMFFSTMSGSSSATTVGVGMTMIPAMERRHYGTPLAAAVIAVGGELGAIIPPSIPLVLYGMTAGVSIGDLFLAGILPGVLIGLSLMVAIICLACLRGFDPAEPKPFTEWLSEVFRALRESVLALLMPFIIIGGIYSGAFTATEAAIVATFYGLFVSVFIYQELNAQTLVKLFQESALVIGIVMLIYTFAAVFGYAMTISQIPQRISATILTFASDPVTFLIVVNAFLLLVGTFMETLATILILGPILAPIAVQYGIDPVHFGIIMIVNAAIGMVTPPVAVNLNLASAVAGINASRIVKPAMMFLGVLMIDLLIISYVPWFSTAFLK